MTFDTAVQSETDVAAAIVDEYRALADLLEASDPAAWTRRHSARAGAPGRSWRT